MIEQVLENLRDIIVANYGTEIGRATMGAPTSPGSLPDLSTVLPSSITEAQVFIHDVPMEFMNNPPHVVCTDIGEEELERFGGSTQRARDVEHTVVLLVVPPPQPTPTQAYRVCWRMAHAVKIAILRNVNAGGSQPDSGDIMDARVPDVSYSDTDALDDGRFNRFAALTLVLRERETIKDPTYD